MSALELGKDDPHTFPDSYWRARAWEADVQRGSAGSVSCGICGGLGRGPQASRNINIAVPWFSS